MRGVTTRQEQRENERRYKEYLRQWEKEHGRMPAPFRINHKAQWRYNDEMNRFGHEDGRAWAESGRSYYAVEAVYRYCMCDDEAEKDKLEAEMLKAIGDDDECPLIGDGSIEDIYAEAWFESVCEVFLEMAAS
jgi:hypothetical protein